MAHGRWDPAPLPDGSYADASRPFSAQDLCNYIPEYAESSGTRSQFKLVGAPGLREFVSFGAGPHRGARDVEGKLFVVSDTHLYWVKSATDVVLLGEIPGRSLVWMTHNQITSGNEVVIYTGSDGYVYNTVTEVFAKITDTGFPGGRCCDFIDQMIIGVDPQGRFLFNSDLSAALNYNDIERYAAEASPDRLVCSIVSHNKVIALGERTIDFFQASQSDEDIANHILFRVEQGATLENGCASRHGVARLDSAVWFIGSDGGFYELRGYTATRVSTFPIEYALSKCNLSKAFLTTFEDRGHKIIYLTCPDGYTFGFDVASRKWHRRQSKGLNRWRLNTLFKWKATGDKQAKWYGGSYRDGLIYQLDWDYMKEGCDEHTRSFRTGVLHDDGNRVTLDALRVEFDSGSEVSTCVDVEPVIPDIADTAAALFLSVGQALKAITSQTGEVWTDHTFPGTGANCASSPEAVVAHSATGTFWYSSDRGNTWSTSASVFPNADFMAYGGGRFVCLIQDGGDVSCVVSDDNGVTWTEGGAVATTDANGIAYGNGNFVVVGSDGVWYSEDGGDTWANAISGNWTAVGFNGTGFLIGANTGSAYEYSLDGITWNVMGGTSTHAALTICGSGGVFLLGMYEDGIYRTTNNGASLTQVQAAGSARFYSSAITGSRAVFGGGGGGTDVQYWTDDLGLTWTLVAPQISDNDICVVPV